MPPGRPTLYRSEYAEIARKACTEGATNVTLAERFGVAHGTIYNWIASGKVEYVRTAGGSVRIFVDTLWREPGRSGELTRQEAS